MPDAERGLATVDDQAADASALTADRLREIRQRVREGSYNDPAVVDAVARRLLGQGDL